MEAIVMSSTSVQIPHDTAAELEPLRARSGWIVALGIGLGLKNHLAVR